MKKFVVRLMVGLGLFLGLLSSARADTAAFDYTTYNTALTGGLVIVGSTAGAIAAIAAGVMVWRKIAKYFQKAG